MTSKTLPQQREMGFWSVLAFVVGSQLGSSVFLMPPQLAPYGFWGICGWAISGMGAVMLALAFSILAQHNTSRGSPHVYVCEAFGHHAAFYVAWVHWVISWLSSVTLIVIAVGALESVVGKFGVFRVWVEVLLILLIMSMNIKSLALSGIFERIFSFLKVLPVVIIPIICLPFLNIGHWDPPHDVFPFEAVKISALLTFWGFIGVETGTTMMNAVKNARVIVPRALFWGTLLVAVLYACNSAVILGLVPRELLVHSEDAYNTVLHVHFGGSWAPFLSCISFVMLMGTLNSWLFASGQISMIAAQDGLFPVFFEKINSRGIPVGGIVVTALLLAGGAVLLENPDVYQQINTLITLSVLLFVVVYGASVLALLWLMGRKKIPQTVGRWTVVVLSFSFCVWVLMTSELSMLLWMLVIPLSGGILQVAAWVWARFFPWKTVYLTRGK